MRKSGSLLVALLVATLTLSPLAGGKALLSAPETRIAIVMGRSTLEYSDAVDGFIEVINKSKTEPQLMRFNLDVPKSEIGAVVARIRQTRPDVILTVGSMATSEVSSRVSDVPIVFSMVLYPVASGFASSMRSSGRNITGAAMDVSIEEQFKLLSRIAPQLKRVGVLYNREETGSVIREAEKAANKMGLVLVAEQVHSEKDIPAAFDGLLQKDIQALWSVADATVFTLPSFKFIIQKTVEKGIPFMGPNGRFDESGALLALNCNSRDNGRQSGELTLLALEGRKPSDIPIAQPRITELALNMRVARFLGLRIPASVEREAHRVIR